MNIPTWITFLRILLIPVFVIFMLKYRQTHLEYFRHYGIFTFVLAVITDAVDGAIARIRNEKTQLGALLDPLADKLLLVSAVLILSIPADGLQQLPIWVLVTFVSRDLMLVFGAIVIYMNNQKIDIRPSILGKMTTLLQMCTVVWILFRFPYPNYMWSTAGIFTIISGLHYMYGGSKQLKIT